MGRICDMIGLQDCRMCDSSIKMLRAYARMESMLLVILR